MDFMKKEANGPLITLLNYKERSLKACGISERVYRQIVKKKRKVDVTPGCSFTSPSKKKIKRNRSKTFLEDAGPVQCIRDIIYNFYIIEKRRPSLEVVILL